MPAECEKMVLHKIVLFVRTELQQKALGEGTDFP